MPLTLAIICYNSAATITECLGPLLDTTAHQAWIVDNNSSDDSANKLEKRFPNAKIIRNPINLGYGRAANQVLEVCDTPFCFLINPDLLLTEQQIESLLKTAQNSSELAVVGPVYETQDLTNPPQVRFAEWILGAAMLFNRAHFAELGYFDPNIFLFAEETELALKTLRSGRKLGVDTGTYVQHLGGRSSPPSERLIKIKNFHLGWSNAYVKNKYGLDKGSKTARLKYTQLRWKEMRARNTEQKLAYRYQALGVKHFIDGRGAFTTEQPVYSRLKTMRQTDKGLR